MGMWADYPDDGNDYDMPPECEDCEILDCIDWCKTILDLYKPAREQE
jgi:hypothetical protein